MILFIANVLWVLVLTGVVSALLVAVLVYTTPQPDHEKIERDR